ncbi:hypothetical protein [Bacillus safensis]|uniref:hypothetical protein n=1 Tax=Bacillus safensis TaxID=561879 RepID=UPI003244E6FB
MPQTVITFDELTATVFQDQMQKLFQAAYEKGVEDGMNKNSYPPLLTNQHLQEIFSASRSPVWKITSRPDFPKFNEISGRYPRDLVFRWIEQNSSCIQEITA